MRPPIDILPLFPVLNEQLVSFLKNLSPADWQRQTVAREWKVKDVAAHLLDGNFRRIAVHRDEWTVSVADPIHSYDDLVRYLNGLNADWVKAARRLSPAIIIELLESTNEEVYNIFKGLDPFAESVYPVSWAGENRSFNWFDIAREYTERWLHQQQIREAMNNRDIMTQQLYHPFLDIFMRAWPVAMNVAGEEGTALRTTITGEGGGVWYLHFEKGNWEIKNTEPASFAAETSIDGNVAWKLFSKSIRKQDINGDYQVKGNQLLGEKVLDMISVMA
ncbi:MAG: maleylpyruvate isomerase N-terminal domain-containing protein [Chitinophagaceae bacterium]|nr:maleylpyruvate isomerase N-terminal domain-containing protein [Chitinophagaceae bacterium]